MSPTGHAAELDVIDWRRLQLVDAGFPPRLALTIALDEHADWRQAIRLVEQGCQPGVAWRIVRD